MRTGAVRSGISNISDRLENRKIGASVDRAFDWWHNIKRAMRFGSSTFMLETMRMPKKNPYLYLFLICIVSLLPVSGCEYRHYRGSYFLYGLQWGMSWKEVSEVLKTQELTEDGSKKGEKIVKAPFFIGGVPGQLILTFKKPFFGDFALKGFRYQAQILGSDVRNETFLVISVDDLTPFLGKPSQGTGTPEGPTDDDEAGGPYSVMWRNGDGDVYLEVVPKAHSFVLRAEANTANPKLEWLK